MSYRDTLLKPIKIGNLTAQNRFFIQAMECNDQDEEGNPSERTTERYVNLAKGEAGVITLEAISITKESVARDKQLLILPENQKALTEFVKKVKAANPKTLIVFQLTHAGELSSNIFSKRVCVKPLPGYGGTLLTEEDVDKIIDEFVLAAKITHDCGADGIDMKLCHGYLGSQILRPYNDRKWKYGGSWENRSRFAFELYERIQKEVNDPNFLIGSKISCWEGFPGGFGTNGPDSPIIDMTEPLALMKGLEERGAQYFVQSLGSPSINPSLLQPDKHVPFLGYLHQSFANQMKKNLRPETVVIGSTFSVFRNGKNGLNAVTPEQSSMFNYGAQCIDRGVVDMLALGRQSFADPFLPKKLREGKEDQINWCTVCDNCLELLIQQSHVGCCTYDKRYTQELVKTRQAKGKLKVSHT